MHLGLSPYGLPLSAYAEVLRTAEEVGFESVWMPDHIVIPAQTGSRYPYSTSGDSGLHPGSPFFDPWVALAHIAAQTTTVQLGTYVTILPLRPPLVTAKAVATLAVLAGGRTILGVGSGWLVEELHAVGMPSDRRGSRTEEAVALMRALWSQDLVEWQGEHYAFAPLGMAPKPPEPIPILMGGHSQGALRRAARSADGWMGSGQGSATMADHLEDVLGRLAPELQAAGRDSSFEITAGLLGLPSPRDYEIPARAGVDRLIVTPWAYTDQPIGRDEALRVLESLGRDMTRLGHSAR